MKRRKVMRLLAVAMAASVALTSQGIPVGLTAVYAADGGLTVDSQTGLQKGHLYQQVDATVHEHDENCFENGAVAAKTKGIEQGLFVKVDEEVYKSDGCDGITKLQVTNDNGGTDYYVSADQATSGYVIPSEDKLTFQLTDPTNQVILADSASSSIDGGAATYSVYTKTAVNGDKIYEIEAARLNDQKTAGNLVTYLKNSDLDTYTGYYDTTTKNTTTAETSAAEGTTVHRLNEADAATNIKDGYYTVVKYAKSTDTSDTAKNLPGAIVITEADAASKPTAYTDTLGFTDTSLTAGDVYLPLEVVAVSDFAYADANTRVTVGSGDNAVEYLATDAAGSWASITKAEEADQPAAAYTYDSDSGNFIIKLATVAEPLENVEHNTYSYKKISVVEGAVKQAESATNITEGTVYAYDTDGDGTKEYYIDVCDDYVTKIAVKEKNTQYVTDSTAETALKDAVELTFGDAESTQKQTLNADVVLSTKDSSGYQVGADYSNATDITIQSITDTQYMYAAVDTTSTYGIVTLENSKLLSSIADFSSVTGVDVTGATYKVQSVTAPTASIEVSKENATEIDSATTGLDKTVYDVTTNDSKVSVAVTVDETSATSLSGGWTYKLHDVVVDDTSETEKNSDNTAKAKSEFESAYKTTKYDIDSTKIGHHKIYVEAISGDITVKSLVGEFYVVKEDSDASITYASDFKYTGNSTGLVTATNVNGSQDTSKITYSYQETDSEHSTEIGSTLPVNAGTYTITAVIPANYEKGYKTTTKTTESVTIAQADLETIDYGSTTAILASDTEGDRTVKLSDILSKYETGDSGNFTATKSGNYDFVLTDSTDTTFATATFASDTLTYKLQSGLSASSYTSGATLTGTLSNRNYKVKVTVTVMIKSADTKEHDFSALNDITVFYGDYTAETLLSDIIAKGDSNTSYYSVAYGTSKNQAFPTGVQEDGALIYITYDNQKTDSTAEYGTVTKTLTIKKKAITLTAASQTINVGESFNPADFKNYTIATKAADIASGSKEIANSLPDDLTAIAKFTDNNNNDAVVDNVSNAKRGSYTLSYTIGGSAADYYDVDITTATLTVNGAAQSAPAADPTLTFTPDPTSGKYTLAIDESALSDGTVEYSTDGTTFSASVKSDLEGATYASGAAVSFYVRYAADDTHEASPASAIITKNAPAALATPTISSEYTSDGGKTVTITSADSDVTIYYTLDGNAPTSASTKYEKPFTVAASDLSSKNVTVKAIAVKENTLDSAVATATLTKKSEAPYTPASGTDTDKTPSTTTEPTIKENSDGDKVIVDADGKVIADELVTIDGKSYVTDENGEVLTSQIAEVGDVKVYVGKNGVVATDKAVTYEGKKYYATETGEIATNSFVTTARGNKVYATKTGELKTSTTFTVKGKKYYAKASGAIATTGFVKTAKGNTVYATKTGALQVNKAFKASNGKKYVADKNGKIVKGKKITIGKKTYTTNKKGVIVKVTTKKK